MKHNRIPLLASPADTALSAVERQVLEQLPVCAMVLGSGGEVVFLSSRAGDLLRKSGIKMDARKLDDWLIRRRNRRRLKSGIAECLAREPFTGNYADASRWKPMVRHRHHRLFR